MSLSQTRYSWQLLRAGPLKLDGGSMFGVVPRVIWSKLMPADERGRIELAHNCLLLTRVDRPQTKVLIEVGSGDKFDAKTRDIFGLTDRSIREALIEAGVQPEEISDVIVSHLHFDHAGGLTRRVQPGERPDWAAAGPEGPGFEVKFTFANATIHAQGREFEDALHNKSVMTRTYLRENLEPLRERGVRLIECSPPFPEAHVPQRDGKPRAPLVDRFTEVLSGIFAFLVPGHTWGQHALLFVDDRGQTVVFTPDIMPTAQHVGAAYNMAYDVEPYISTVTRGWFLDEAARNDWLLVIDHEPGDPRRRVRPDQRGGWFSLHPVD
jgi:glyoxylase-like metal-dependent hydrolase (beta-lactamase superfamily II)